MELVRVLELMVEVAKAEHVQPCLGILVRKDGSGRTTPATLATNPSGIESCTYGKSKLEWSTPAEGAKLLAQQLLIKCQPECRAVFSNSEEDEAAEQKGGE